MDLRDKSEDKICSQAVETSTAQTKRQILQGRRFVDLSDECGNVVLVAEDLEQEIRLANEKSTTLQAGKSSPVNPMASFSATSSSAAVLKELERQAHHVAARLNDALLEFGGSLDGATHLSAECAGAYGRCAWRTCDAADATVRATYQMLAKCEELMHGLKTTLPPLAKQIKEIKRLLDLFESHLQKSQG